MENVEIVEIDYLGNVQEFAVIDRGNNEFTSMPKAVWDAQEAAKETGTLS